MFPSFIISVHVPTHQKKNTKFLNFITDNYETNFTMDTSLGLSQIPFRTGHLGPCEGQTGVSKQWEDQESRKLYTSKRRDVGRTVSRTGFKTKSFILGIIQ